MKKVFAIILALALFTALISASASLMRQCWQNWNQPMAVIMI